MHVRGCRGDREAQILDTLESLLDKSLVRKRDSKLKLRYWMLETIREYAVEQLEASGEADELRRRHAEWFLDLAEEAEPYLREGSQEWIARLDAEHDNMRSALDFCGVSREGQLSMRLTGALTHFWLGRGHLSEGRRRLEAALSSDARPTTARSKALTGASFMALRLGDHESARARAQEALRLYRDLDDPWGVAYATMTVGVTFAEAGDLAAARPFLEASMLAFRELGNEYYTGVAAENVAWVVHGLGDKHRARALLEENLERARALNNRRHEMIAIDGLAIFARDDGRLEEALSMLGEVLKFSRELGDRLELAIGLGSLAEVLALAGESYRAACLLASSEALTEEIDARTPWWAAERNEKTARVIRERLDEYVFDQAWGQGAKLSLEEACALALGEAERNTNAKGGP